MRKLLASFLLFCFPVWAIAQSTTTITLSNTSHRGNVIPFGANLNGNGGAYFGNQQVGIDLLQGYGFNAPTSYETIMKAASCTANTFTDQINNYSNIPAGFWNTATFQLNTGTSLQLGNPTLHVVSSTAIVNGSNGLTLTLDGSMPGGACGVGDDATVILKLPPCTWVGEPTPTQISSTGSGTFRVVSGTPVFDCNDYSSSSGYTRSMSLPSGSSVEYIVDAPAPGGDNERGQTDYLNLNGTYTMTGRYKSTATGGAVNLSFGRNTSIYNKTFTPTANASNGAGWVNFSDTFTAAETGSQVNQPATLVLTASGGGNIKIADFQITENQVGTNPTSVRAAVLARLKKYNPSSLRGMSIESWNCPPDQMMTPLPQRRLCGGTLYNHFNSSFVYMGFPEQLALDDAIGAQPWLNLGPMTPQDAINVTNWLGGSGYLGNTINYIAKFAAKGQYIRLEPLNESWNSGTPYFATMWGDYSTASGYIPDGTGYGKWVGTLVSASKTASAYTSTIRWVANGWAALGQTNSGRSDAVASAAGCPGGSGCPYAIDGAPYQFNSMTQTGTNAAVFNPMFNEPYIIDAQSGGYMNVFAPYMASTYGLKVATYETNLSTTDIYSGLNQSQIDGYVAGIGAGLAAIDHMELQRTAADVEEPIHAFNIFGSGWDSFQRCAADGTGCADAGGSGLVMPLWSINFNDASSSAQQPSTKDIDRPFGTMMQMVNANMAGKTQWLTSTQTGTPTQNQAANSQPGGYTPIPAGNGIPIVQSFLYGDGAGAYQLDLINLSITQGNLVNLAGLSLPSNVTMQQIGANTNAITDNVETTSLTSGSGIAPTISTLNSPTSMTLPAFSLSVLNWNTSGSSTPTSNPTSSLAAGTYTGAQTATLSDSTSGAAIEYCLSTSGSACNPNLAYSSPVSITATETLYAFATASGDTQSSTVSFAYTINTPVAPTPTISLGTGTYTGSQTVSLADSLSGSSIRYTLDGSAPSGTSALYSAPLTIATSETLRAIALKSGYTNSGIASATYTISAPAAAACGNMTAASTVSITITTGPSATLTIKCTN